MSSRLSSLKHWAGTYPRTAFLLWHFGVFFIVSALAWLMGHPKPGEIASIVALLPTIMAIVGMFFFLAVSFVFGNR